MFKLFNSLFLKLPKFANVEWSSGDAVNLHKFLVSETGTKFKQLLDNESIAHNAWAVNKTENHAYENGRARGFSTCIETIQAISSRDTEQEVADTTDLIRPSKHTGSLT